MIQIKCVEEILYGRSDIPLKIFQASNGRKLVILEGVGKTTAWLLSEELRAQELLRLSWAMWTQNLVLLVETFTSEFEQALKEKGYVIVREFEYPKYDPHTRFTNLETRSKK